MNLSFPTPLPDMGASRLSLASVDFLLVKLDEQAFDMLPWCIHQAVKAAEEGGAVIEHLLGSLLVITYGATPACPASAEKRQALAQRLASTVTFSFKEQPPMVWSSPGSAVPGPGDARPRAAVLHGRQETLAGLFGSEVRLTFGSLLHNLPALLAELATMEFGEVKEVSC